MSVLWNGPTKAAMTRLAGLRRRQEERQARRETEMAMPELLTAYAAFSRGQQSGSVRQPFKGWDLWHILEDARPRVIAEMGSGTTSAVFALYARRSGGRYVCYEHSADWAEVTRDSLAEAGLRGEGIEIRTVAMREDPSRPATGFVEPIPTEADFVYVDGPPCPTRDGVKWPNDDVVRLLESGGRPSVIVVDGRVETVDLIRRHPAAADYRVEASFVYALRRGTLSDALGFREHSILRRTGR